MVREPMASDWAPAYLRAREIEGRLYPDPAVAALPSVPASDPLAREWLARADSAARLAAYIRGRPRPMRILDVGCGNGWLTARLASIEGTSVVGLDSNEVELAQARRVFGHLPNARFVLGDIEVADPPPDAPSIIVLASVAQYVEDLRALIRRLRSWLAPDGELHIIDTPFYATSEVPAARERSERHYREIGVPEMAGIYRHHEWRVLEPFDPAVLHDPASIGSRISRRVLRRSPSPFPWIRIRA